ncbi:MAG: phage terminase large subunit family protein [Beijerinckiaceae bacterium]|nr:phage terminase large subunit family protein [Beijerinckiaceae bacterium]
MAQAHRLERGRKIRRGARLWTIAVATFESETYRYLRLAAPTDEELAAGVTAPPGFIHLPQGAPVMRRNQ